MSIVAALLFVGVVVDQAFTQPRARKLAAVSQQRAMLLGQVGELGAEHVQGSELSAMFNLDDFSDLLDKPAAEPLSYVGSLLDRMKLKRLALTHAGTVAAGELQRTKFTLHLSGSYPRLVAFIRALEQGPRLATLDAFTIETPIGSSGLEAKLNISIYDPMPRKAK